MLKNTHTNNAQDNQFIVTFSLLQMCRQSPLETAVAQLYQLQSCSSKRM